MEYKDLPRFKTSAGCILEDDEAQRRFGLSLISYDLMKLGVPIKDLGENCKTL